MNMHYVKGQLAGFVPVTIEQAAVTMPKRWFVLKTFANKESRVARTFVQRGISFYYPVVRGSKVARGSKRIHISPLFAGIIFIPDFQAELGGVRVEGVDGYFKMGDCYPSLKPDEMEGVRALERLLNIPVARKRRLLREGDPVRLVTGPFAQYEAKIERLDSNGRLKVLISIFGRMTSALVAEDQIEPA